MHKHWTPQRKAAIVIDIIEDKTTVEQACEQYDLSVAELTQWQRAIEQHGVYGLRVTRLHCYHPERRRTSKWRPRAGTPCAVPEARGPAGVPGTPASRGSSYPSEGGTA
jgi:hypothetical protein